MSYDRSPGSADADSTDADSTDADHAAVGTAPSLLALVDEAARVVAEVAAVADARSWALAPAQRVEALEHLAVLRRTADAAHLALVRSLGDDEAVALGARSTSALLAWRLLLRPGQARADVRDARATDPERGDLAALGAELAAGRTTAAHVSVAARALERLPVALRREHAGAVDAFLAEHSTHLPPQQCDVLAAVVLERVDPQGCARRSEPADHARRHLDLSTDASGMLLVRGRLDPVAGATLRAAVDHHAAPTPAVDAVDEDGATVRLLDERTPGQRRADALGEIARRCLDASSTRGGEPPRIIVHATVDQLAGRSGAGAATCEQTGPLAASTLGHLACDAVLQAVVTAPSGGVLHLGRAVRVISPAQRRAVLGRDGGCAVPGCTAPSAQLEGHHVLAWADGGATDVDNLVLVCGPHHRMVTAGTWALRMVDRLPRARAPRWVDPQQRWVVDPARAARRAAEGLGHRLASGGGARAPGHRRRGAGGSDEHGPSG